MNITVLIVLIVVLVIALLLIFLLVRGQRLKRKMQSDVLADALPAQATVLNLDDSYATGETLRKLEITLSLRVDHPDRPSYNVTSIWRIDAIALPQVQPQKIVPVRINRDDPELIYPDAEWAELADWTMKDL